MGAVLAIACCLYKLYRAHQKAENRQNMSEQEKQRIGKKIDRLLDKLEKALANESLDKKSKKIYVKRLEKYLDLNEGLLAGDGSDEDD
jgi:tRNA C32,U32 (ribose-2'-O)-methylase TrmJ